MFNAKELLAIWTVVGENVCRWYEWIVEVEKMEIYKDTWEGVKMRFVSRRLAGFYVKRGRRTRHWLIWHMYTPQDGNFYYTYTGDKE